MENKKVDWIKILLRSTLRAKRKTPTDDVNCFNSKAKDIK